MIEEDGQRRQINIITNDTIMSRRGIKKACSRVIVVQSNVDLHLRFVCIFLDKN